MLIPRWAKFAAVAVALAGLFLGWQAYRAHVFGQGYEKARGEAKTREERIRADALEQFNKEAGEAKAREEKLRSGLAAADAQRYKDNTRHEKIISDLRGRARAGDLGLRVDVAAGSLFGCPASESRPVTARPGDETRADLVPGVVDALLRLAGDSARDVRRHNDLVDRYNAVVELCNGSGVTAP